MLKPDAMVKANPEMLVANMGNELVILDSNSNQYFGLNAVGTHFWEHLQDGATFSQIVDLIVKDFNIDKETCEKDINALLGDMQERGLIEIDA